MRMMSDIVRNRDPAGLPPSATAKDACRCMRVRRVGAVLVGPRAITACWASSRGVNAVHRVLAEGKSAARTKLAEVMTRDPETIPPGKTKRCC
jgi:hypothetical protein